jgi:hypothetical protein
MAHFVIEQKEETRTLRLDFCENLKSSTRLSDKFNLF